MANEKAILKADTEIEKLKLAKEYKPTEIVQAIAKRDALYNGLEALYKLRKDDFGVSE
jgi:hypothetical protein